MVAGFKAGLHTVLVLTGISDQAGIERHPFCPDEILQVAWELVERDAEESDL